MPLQRAWRKADKSANRMVRPRKREVVKRDNAKRVVVRTTHPGLREWLPKLSRITQDQADELTRHLEQLLTPK